MEIGYIASSCCCHELRHRVIWLSNRAKRSFLHVSPPSLIKQQFLALLLLSIMVYLDVVSAPFFFLRFSYSSPLGPSLVIAHASPLVLPRTHFRSSYSGCGKRLRHLPRPPPCGLSTSSSYLINLLLVRLVAPSPPATAAAAVAPATLITPAVPSGCRCYCYCCCCY